LPIGGTTSPVVRSMQRGNGASSTVSPSLSYWKAACLKHQPMVLLYGDRSSKASRAHQ
jgi:hypothetical protein